MLCLVFFGNFGRETSAFVVSKTVPISHDTLWLKAVATLETLHLSFSGVAHIFHQGLFCMQHG